MMNYLLAIVLTLLMTPVPTTATVQQPDAASIEEAMYEGCMDFLLRLNGHFVRRNDLHDRCIRVLNEMNFDMPGDRLARRNSEQAGAHEHYQGCMAAAVDSVIHANPTEGVIGWSQKVCLELFQLKQNALPVLPRTMDIFRRGI